MMLRFGLFFVVFAFNCSCNFLSAQSRIPFNLLIDDSIQKKQNEKELLAYHQSLLKKIENPYKKDYTSIYEERFKYIRETVTSSSTITAQKANNYLQAIVNKIVSVNKELQDKPIRVFFSRSEVPNAYSMGDGSIAINIGLVNFLTTEAELAFVICHELAHFYLQHTDKAIKNYVETINSTAYQNEVKRLSKQEFNVNKEIQKIEKTIVFDVKKHSRSNELEADNWAYRFLKNTQYNTKGVITCLQVLNNIDDSLQAQKVKLDSILHFANYQFKKSWLQNETSIFSKMNHDEEVALTKQELDSLKTHPDCLKRIGVLKDSIAKDKNVNDFTISDSLFYQLKFSFQKEINENHFELKAYSKNLFYALYLLQNNQHRAYAIYSIARCFNLMYEAQKNHTLGKYVDKENRYFSADYNKILRFIDKVKIYELASINYFFCEQYKSQMQQFPAFMKEYTVAQKNYQSN
ncbi:MAG: M48 family metallopeptidase [Chitinophagaceae bacterium]